MKRRSISSTASRLFRNTSRHITGSEAAMRVKSRKPPAENLITSALRRLLEIGRGADDGIGDEMRQMRGDGQHPVVMRGAPSISTLHAGALPRVRPSLSTAAGVGAGRRGQDAPAAVGTARRSPRPGRNARCRRPDGRGPNGRPGARCGPQIADDRLLDRADIGEDRARLQCRRRLRLPISA